MIWDYVWELLTVTVMGVPLGCGADSPLDERRPDVSIYWDEDLTSSHDVSVECACGAVICAGEDYCGECGSERGGA